MPRITIKVVLWGVCVKRGGESPAWVVDPSGNFITGYSKKLLELRVGQFVPEEGAVYAVKPMDALELIGDIK